MLCGDENIFNLINRKFKNSEHRLNDDWIIFVFVKNLGKNMIVHYFAFLKQYYAFFAINFAFKIRASTYNKWYIGTLTAKNLDIINL